MFFHQSFKVIPVWKTIFPLVFKTLKTNLFLTMACFSELLQVRDKENSITENNILINFTLPVSLDENKDNLLGKNPRKIAKNFNDNEYIDNFYINIEVEIVSCLAPLLSFIKALIPSCFVGAYIDPTFEKQPECPEYEEGMKIFYYKRKKSVKESRSIEDKRNIQAIFELGKKEDEFGTIGMLTNGTSGRGMTNSTNRDSAYPGNLLEGTIIHSDDYHGPFKVLLSSGSRDEDVMASDIVYTVKPVIEFQNMETLLEKIDFQSSIKFKTTSTQSSVVKLINKDEIMEIEQSINSNQLVPTSAHLLRIFKYATSNETSPRIYYTDISKIFEEGMEMIAGIVSWLLINNLLHHLQGISCWNHEEDDDEHSKKIDLCHHETKQLEEFYDILKVVNRTSLLEWLKKPAWLQYSTFLQKKLETVIKKHKHSDRRKHSN